MLQLAVLKKIHMFVLLGYCSLNLLRKRGRIKNHFQGSLNFKMKMFIKSILFATLFDVNVNFLYTRNK